MGDGDENAASDDRVHGASARTVRAALDSGDPLPGTRGFAGELDGRLVRDVLGRVPLFAETDDHRSWALDHRELDSPERLQAGYLRTGAGDERAWTLPDPPVFEDDSAAVDAVETAVRESLDAVDPDGLAVAFSGGVDSAAVAAALDAPLYVAGFPDSHDVEAAQRAADLLGEDLRVIELDHADLEQAVPGVAAATGRTNAMDVQITLPLYLVAERAAADGYDALAVGQGADELFGGYAKVAHAPEDPRVEADIVRGARREMIGTLPDQLERDVLALREAGVRPVAPLLDDRVVSAALRLPGEMLVTERGDRKWTLRRAVRPWVPDAVAFREKKAVQYGSLVARELDRLARQDGFKRRMDDHVTQYVESLIDE
jgi:asparagine synthase (glutamine-hydrolysing)